MIGSRSQRLVRANDFQPVPSVLSVERWGAVPAGRNFVVHHKIVPSETSSAAVVSAPVTSLSPPAPGAGPARRTVQWVVWPLATW